MDAEAAALAQQAEALEAALAKQRQHCKALKVLNASTLLLPKLCVILAKGGSNSYLVAC